MTHVDFFVNIDIKLDVYLLKDGFKMLIEELNYNLKNGKSALFRSPNKSDVNGFLNVLRTSVNETDFLLHYPEECDVYTIERETEFVDKMNRSIRDAILVCVVDENVVGYFQLFCESDLKTRHRANVSLVILKEYWNLGIGSIMFNIMFEYAKGDPYLLQLELDYTEGNTRARKLYEKMGFIDIGSIPNATRTKNGTMLKDFLMIKELTD